MPVLNLANGVAYGAAAAQRVYLGATQVWAPSTPFSVSQSVTAGGDDWQSGTATGGIAFDAASVTGGFGDFASNATDADFGSLFRTVAIPHGATVSAATFSLTAHVVDTGTLPLTFRIRAAQLASPPTSQATNAAITKTTAYVDWTITAWTAGTRYTSPDISTVIAEVVAGGGWSSGSNLAVFMTSPTVGWGGSGHYLRARTYNWSSGSAAALTASGTG